MRNKNLINSKNVFWIASILFVLLLTIHVFSFTQVTEYTDSDLGLLTKLPITFWVGLSYLAILLYVGRKSGPQMVIVVILISFYLAAMPVLIKENKAEGLGISYFFSSQGTGLLSQNHLELGSLDLWDLRNWPGFFFVTASISSATGLSSNALADYFPLLTMGLLGIIAYSVLRLKLNTVYSSLGALWFIASFWTGQHYYSPQSFAYLMYFAIFLLYARILIGKSRKMVFELLIILLFSAVVVTHLLTSFFILASMIIIYILHRILHRSFESSFFSIKVILLLTCIFLIYQVMVIPNAFSNIAKVLVEQISASDTHLVAISHGRSVGSTPLTMQIIGTYSITIINAIMAGFAVAVTTIGILLRKKEWNREIFWISWIIGAGAFGLSIRYGGEALNRALMFMLIPAAYFAVRFLSKRPKILVIFLLFLVFLYLPARYCSDNYVYAPTSELSGISFYAYHAPSNVTLFYEDLIPVGPPIGPAITGEQLAIIPVSGVYSLPDPDTVNYLTGRAEFLISSSMEKNLYMYFYGINLLENVSFNAQYTPIYDNGDLQIYRHRIT
jgi:hypothetical protein